MDIQELSMQKKVKIRNLKVKFFKFFDKKNFSVNKNEKYTEEDIQKKIYFKIKDVEDFKDVFFEPENQDEFVLKEDVYNEILQYKVKKTLFNDEIEILRERLYQNYQELKSSLSNFREFQNKQHVISETAEYAAKLHWVYLPLYPEQMMINIGIVPEEDLLEYYSHYHSIEDLYRVIFEGEEKKWDDNEGDINLNREMRMKIYSARFSSYDSYIAIRTLSGWTFKHLSYDVKCQKDGTVNEEKNSGFFAILYQDSIQSPVDGIKHAFSTLWEMADSSAMEVEELQNMLQDIAEWINEVEKTIKFKQPNWVGYY